ncbi:hypothetical protein [uncultured Legionella sp.]|uniref:hypothetical protein n=1 Tax=uncultured Legionella sp. TaxID=210934 RepID=UPI00345DF2DD
MLYTDYGYRINPIKEDTGYNWLFLPGGPGLGSQYLIEFSEQIKLPGAIKLLDFPKDGTIPKGCLILITGRLVSSIY